MLFFHQVYYEISESQVKVEQLFLFEENLCFSFLLLCCFRWGTLTTANFTHLLIQQFSQFPHSTDEEEKRKIK